jgi:hypothetical protein
MTPRNDRDTSIDDAHDALTILGAALLGVVAFTYYVLA